MLKDEVVNTSKGSYESLPSIGLLLQSLHLHVDMVETFREMVKKGELNHAKAFYENNLMQLEWDDFSRKNNIDAK